MLKLILTILPQQLSQAENNLFIDISLCHFSNIADSHDLNYLYLNQMKQAVLL